LISIFLDWFTVSVNTSVLGSVSGSGSGTAAHGYLYAVFVFSLVVVAFLVLRAGWAQLPFKLPVPEDQLLVGLTGINLLVTLIAFIFKPSAGVLAATEGISVSWAFGAFIGLIAALAAFGSAIWPLVKPRIAK